MGEKLLAQRLIRLLRDTNGRSSRTALALLDWAADQRDWLWPDIAFAGCGGGRRRSPGETLSWERLPALADAIDTDEPEPALFASRRRGRRRCSASIRSSARCCASSRRWTGCRAWPRCRGRLFGGGEDLLALVGRLAGADARRRGAARAALRAGRARPAVRRRRRRPWRRHATLGVDWRFARGPRCRADRRGRAGRRARRASARRRC